MAVICTVSGQVSAQYYELKADWMNLVLQGRVSDDVKTVMNMVGRGDVLHLTPLNFVGLGEEGCAEDGPELSLLRR